MATTEQFDGHGLRVGALRPGQKAPGAFASVFQPISPDPQVGLLVKMTGHQGLLFLASNTGLFVQRNCPFNKVLSTSCVKLFHSLMVVTDLWFLNPNSLASMPHWMGRQGNLPRDSKQANAERPRAG